MGKLYVGDSSKPPYRIPSMAEIAALPKNGLTVVSTFSGCGGSCLGFEMAGYTILWASEFVPTAAETYRLNHPGVILDTRDMRQVTAEEILAAIGRERGDVDVLEGSPPCAAFSTAGKRAASWGQIRSYSDTKQRVDDLFAEFARLLDGLQPRTFIAENVSGLVKGVAKGYFKETLRMLKACGYRVEARLLDAQWLGVPQARQRIIFMGIRNDLDARHAWPAPLPYYYSVRDALPHIIRQGDNGDFGGGALRPATVPSPTIGAGPQSGNGMYPSSLVETRRGVEGIETFKGVRSADLPAPTVLSHGRRSTRNELSVVEGDISGYAIADEWDRLPLGGQSAKYFQLVRADPERPSNTITAEGGDVTKASVTHPTERRKFTIAELKRICAFPDDFRLTGTYAQQWERLGRSVPPLMMRAVAERLRDEVLA